MITAAMAPTYKSLSTRVKKSRSSASKRAILTRWCRTRSCSRLQSSSINSRPWPSARRPISSTGLETGEDYRDPWPWFLLLWPIISLENCTQSILLRISTSNRNQL